MELGKQTVMDAIKEAMDENAGLRKRFAARARAGKAVSEEEVRHWMEEVGADEPEVEAALARLTLSLVPESSSAAALRSFEEERGSGSTKEAAEPQTAEGSDADLGEPAAENPSEPATRDVSTSAWDAAWARNIKSKAMAYVAKYAPSGSEAITEAIAEMEAAEASADLAAYEDAARRACMEARRIAMVEKGAENGELTSFVSLYNPARNQNGEDKGIEGGEIKNSVGEINSPNSLTHTSRDSPESPNETREPDIDEALSDLDASRSEASDASGADTSENAGGEDMEARLDALIEREVGGGEEKGE